MFGIVPDSTLQLLKEALPHLQINSSHFTTIARPTTGNKKNQEIWGIKCRLALQKPSCLWSIHCRMVSPLFFVTGKIGRKPTCWSTRYFKSWFSLCLHSASVLVNYLREKTRSVALLKWLQKLPALLCPEKPKF